jgi:hypothetical protein
VAEQTLGTRRTGLSAFDKLGRVISMLVDEKREKGTHEVAFGAAGPSSGVHL